MKKEMIMGKILVTVVLLATFSMAGTMKDSRDGQTYKTVKIGNQVWMAENLNYKTGESKCYDNKESNCKKYGRLYTWGEEALNACPTGWHLPSKEEFGTLLATTVGASFGDGSNLRAGSWKNGKDKYGFSALPAGDYYSFSEKFRYLGYHASFWSSTAEYSSNRAYSLNVSDRDAYVYNDFKNLGNSVRCLQDSNEGGEASSQRSEAQPPSGTLKDSRDGQTYKTVKIGNQVWMAENLNYKTDDGSTCYDSKESNCEKYGRLYTWKAAQNACPTGWHLPSKEEFGTLLATVGASSGDGSNLRAGSWKNGKDKYGFSALPAGYYDSYSKEFYNLGDYTYFWSFTEFDSSLAYFLRVLDFNAVVGSLVKNYGASVRCLQDSN